MMRFKKTFSLASCLGIALLGVGVAPGCVENRSSLFVAGMVAPDVAAAECEYEADPEAPMFAQGLYDYATGKPYVALVLLGNQLRALVDKDNLKTETSRIQIEGVEVTLTALTGGGRGGAYTVPVTGTVHPDAGDDAGYSVVPVPLIPGGFLNREGTYQATMVFFGRTTGGVGIESGEYSFAVDACDGCRRCRANDIVPECVAFQGQDNACYPPNP